MAIKVTWTGRDSPRVTRVLLLLASLVSTEGRLHRHLSLACSPVWARTVVALETETRLRHFQGLESPDGGGQAI